MTKCTVIFEQQKQGKPIEFVKYLESEGMYSPARFQAKDFVNVELIALKCYNGLDVMFAYDHNRKGGFLVFGHWNDGIV
jgi:hypothetical protein